MKPKTLLHIKEGNQYTENKKQQVKLNQNNSKRNMININYHYQKYHHHL